MSTFTLEIQLAPNVETLLNKILAALSPKSAAVPSMPAQSPEELAARAKMNPPALTPRPAAPATPVYDPRNPLPPSVSRIYPQMPPQQFQPAPRAPGYPANPQMPAPMQSNPMMGAGNMAPVAGPAPSQPAPIALSTNPLTAGSSTSQPAGYPSNPAPVAGTPQYSAEDLSRAAAQLMDAGKQQELLNLLQQFGIPTVNSLPKERLGEFATALRGMGARI